VAEDALALAASYAGALGADAALDEVRRVIREGNGADRMRAAHARGGLPAVVRQLVEDSYG
jgi:carboxylate-amine ligase